MRLKPLWDKKQLAIVEATGSPDPSRSHFDAQDYMESGTPGKSVKRRLDELALLTGADSRKPRRCAPSRWARSCRARLRGDHGQLSRSAAARQLQCGR